MLTPSSLPLRIPAKNDRSKMGRLGLGLGILFWGIEEKEDEDVERYETNFYIYVNKI